MWGYLILSISAVVGFNLLLFLVLRHSSKRFSRLHLRRRIQHSSSGIVILCLYYYAEKQTVGLIALLSAIGFLAFDIYRRRIDRAFNEAFINNFGWILRTYEYYDRPMGAMFFLFGVSVVLYLTKVDMIVYLSILNLSFCDPAASMVGSTIVSPKITSNKSVSGTSAAAVTGVLVAALYSIGSGVSVNLWAAGAIALVAEVVQLPGVDDNLTIPAISCALWKFYCQDFPCLLI